MHLEMFEATSVDMRTPEREGRGTNRARSVAHRGRRGASHFTDGREARRGRSSAGRPRPPRGRAARRSGRARRLGRGPHSPACRGSCRARRGQPRRAPTRRDRAGRPQRTASSVLRLTRVRRLVLARRDGDVDHGVLEAAVARPVHAGTEREPEHRSGARAGDRQVCGDGARDSQVALPAELERAQLDVLRVRYSSPERSLIWRRLSVVMEARALASACGQRQKGPPPAGFRHRPRRRRSAPRRR